jgi:multidrug efflux pump subunit AcrA (membrane-fusion protein)
VEQLEKHLGVAWPTGSLTLGQVVFKPQALRVAQVTGSPGGTASGPVLTATSDQEQVTVPLDVAQQSRVKVGDAVSVTLPDGSTTPGVVSRMGTVAVTSGSGTQATTTISVSVRLVHPSAAGSLDSAPVTVDITTQTARDALVVPVGALLAEGSGGYDVEVVGPGSTRRYVPVTIGIFDDGDGLVQVTGALTPGQRVVVPAR